MDYFQHNDSKGADARYRLAVNRAERARNALPFDGTLTMSKNEMLARRLEVLMRRQPDWLPRASVWCRAGYAR